MTSDERRDLEAKCQRRVMENLTTIGKQIGPRTRMMQIISSLGVVDGLRSMRNEETSGWNDLYLAGLLGYSVEATIVESLAFRQLFEPEEIRKMESELRDSGYKPRVAE
ncbi:MAG TPA: hypothetical protein VFE16_08825 [Candidatus Cybelea sp.]|nr:hypothetical protein [Candidatus Cybelea sp.]